MPDEKPDVVKLLQKADFPNRQAEAWHPFYKGKIEITPKVKVDDFSDFAVWYTPGVARICKMIEEEMILYRRSKAAYTTTNKWNNVAIVSGEHIPPLVDGFWPLRRISECDARRTQPE